MAGEDLKLNLGCELHTPEGWINLDGSWGARLAKYPTLRRLLKPLKVFPRHLLEKAWNRNLLVHDVRKPLPFEDGRVSVVYASHLLEHLYLTEGKNLLKECYRILRPGGIIRLVVPDLRAMVEEYLGGDPIGGAEGEREETCRGDRLNRRLGLREENPPAGSLIYRLYSGWTDFHSHKWMYDAESLIRHVREAGFVEVAARPAQESRIADIEKVELPERIRGGHGVCVEGLKPAP